MNEVIMYKANMNEVIMHKTNIYEVNMNEIIKNTIITIE